ncbi:uncharacterized protein Z520_07759 [Fonsecaea multimorphosa CBS 102226]|uniref:5'-hydroxyaverantin dehydrogenase n=1 Tax=Fonsecaea multimorphosa CBS 102226 TaxID=1442371 RepID=A0A0D2KIQ1_9EURO|nr:uncharacterized protein Z520_07759 [Fonsecaea multimorphosa CBS 102226]KIX96493.1 hypothetical protein Z520_07759 [Fonsecaea multimorphosa CBS 102226]
MASRYVDSPVDCSVKCDRTKVKGKTAIITGGANGIGAAYAKALADAGAYVMIGDLDDVRAERIVSLYPGQIWASHCDVTSWDDQARMFQATLKELPTGRVDIVVANAGISGQDPVFVEDDAAGSTPQKPNLKILDINLIGVMYTIKLALFYFRKQYNAAVASGQEGIDSSLVLQGSLAGFVDQPGSPQYNASKFGLRGTMRCLRRTSLQHGTRVNYIAPWYIKTDIISDAVAERITDKGAVFASIDDAAEALLRAACDKSVCGRALAIVPRIWATLGYLDVDHDDYKEGDFLKQWQEIVLKTSHRLTGPSVAD